MISTGTNAACIRQIATIACVHLRAQNGQAMMTEDLALVCRLRGNACCKSGSSPRRSSRRPRPDWWASTSACRTSASGEFVSDKLSAASFTSVEPRALLITC